MPEPAFVMLASGLMWKSGAVESFAELETRLLDAVRSVCDAESYERFSLRAFRESASHTLTDIREDQRIHGGDERAPFFDLIMFDNGAMERAVYLVPMFLAASVKIVVGVGLPNEVIAMVNRFAMSDVDGMEAELGSKGVADFVEVPLPLAEHWLAEV